MLDSDGVEAAFGVLLFSRLQSGARLFVVLVVLFVCAANQFDDFIEVVSVDFSVKFKFSEAAQLGNDCLKPNGVLRCQS